MMATQTTSTSAKAWSPDVTSFAPDDVIPDALILSTSTVSGSTNGDEPAVRVAYVDDAAAQFVAEGSAIPVDDPGLSEVLVHTGRVSQLVKISKEQWLQSGTGQLLSTSVARAVTKAANTAYLAQAAPTSPAVTPPAGLLNVTGIVDGGAIATSLDALAEVIATLETNGATPSHIIAAPDAWGWLRQLKTATGSNQSLLGAGTHDQERLLFDLPVITTPALTSGSLMVLDKSAIVSATGSVEIAVSEHLYFDEYAVALRATWRFGQNLVHPDRVAKLTVTDPSA